MRIIARDINMVAMNEIDVYTSFIWTDRYSTNGDFELRVPCTENNYNLFNNTFYITIDESDRVMVVESRNIKTEVDKSDEYIIKGRSAETLLDRRIIMGSMTFGTSPYDEQMNDTASQSYAVGDYITWYGAIFRVIKVIQSGDTFIVYDSGKGNLPIANLVHADDEEGMLTEPIENIVSTLLNTTVINPTDPMRRFTNPTWRYQWSNDQRIKEIKMAASFANTNLYDALSSLLVGAGLGCKVVYNEDTHTLDFSLLIGTDHSVSQSENLVVNFKNVLDNLVSTDRVTDDSGYKTCAFVVGAIDDKKTRTTYVADEFGRVSEVEYPNPNYCTTWCQQVSLSGTGMSYQRREVIVDASDIDRYQTLNTSGGMSGTDVAVSESDYRAMLKTRGRNELMGMYSTFNMDAEILPNIFYKYLVDYGLGDTISIQDRFGNTVNAEITELIYSVDSSGYKAYPTLETLGSVDGMDELVSIFVNNPIYVDNEGCCIIPDIREPLQNLREKTYIAYYVKDIIDYLLDDHLISVVSVGSVDSYRIVVPEVNDMDRVIFGADIGEIYNNASAYSSLSTRAIQFVQFFMAHQFVPNFEDIIIPSFDELASSIQ